MARKMKLTETYYGVSLDHHDEVWGDVIYHRLLVPEYYHDDVVTTDLTDIDTDVAVSFLLPDVEYHKYYVDGTVKGHFTLKNKGASGTLVTSCMVELVKVGIANDQETIGSMPYTFPGSGYSLAAGADFKVPIIFKVSHKLISPNQKLLLNIWLFAGENYLQVLHTNDNDLLDVMIEIPYALSSGG